MVRRTEKIVLGRDAVWRKGMTAAGLLEYDIDKEYFAAAVINGLYIPENWFGNTRIPKDAEVWLLPPVGGG